MGHLSPLDTKPSDRQPWLERWWAGSIRFLESGWYEALDPVPPSTADKTTVAYKGVIQ